jgi:hypothetical protein
MNQTPGSDTSAQQNGARNSSKAPQQQQQQQQQQRKRPNALTRARDWIERQGDYNPDSRFAQRFLGAKPKRGRSKPAQLLGALTAMANSVRKRFADRKADKSASKEKRPGFGERLYNRLPKWAKAKSKSVANATPTKEQGKSAAKQPAKAQGAEVAKPAGKEADVAQVAAAKAPQVPQEKDVEVTAPASAVSDRRQAAGPRPTPGPRPRHSRRPTPYPRSPQQGSVQGPAQESPAPRTKEDPNLAAIREQADAAKLDNARAYAKARAELGLDSEPPQDSTDHTDIQFQKAMQDVADDHEKARKELGLNKGSRQQQSARPNANPEQGGPRTQPQAAVSGRQPERRVQSTPQVFVGAPAERAKRIVETGKGAEQLVETLISERKAADKPSGPYYVEAAKRVVAALDAGDSHKAANEAGDLLDHNSGPATRSINSVLKGLQQNPVTRDQVTTPRSVGRSAGRGVGDSGGMSR